MLYAAFLLAGVAAYVAIVTLVDVAVMGVAHRREPAAPSRRPTERPNRIDRQRGNSCGGYSAAYLLRSCGIEADGEAVYASMRMKSPSGSVPPRSVLRALRSRGVQAEYRRGDPDRLRRELDCGPVIAFIRSRARGRGLHFVAVVGYDDDGFLLADSARDWDGVSRYNRRVGFDEFDRLWNVRSVTRPLYSRTYIAVKR